MPLARAKPAVSPQISQMIIVIIAIMITAGTKMPATLSAIFATGAFVAAASLFVYSENGVLNYKPVALCLTYCFVSSIVGNYIIKGTKTAYKFTIISPHANEIAAELIKTLKRGVTKIAAEGEYTHSQKDVLLCVVSKNQLVEFKTVINKYSETFSFCETVNETFGTFNHNKTVAHKELHLDTYS